MTAAHWGCTQYVERRMPRHLVDNERSQALGEWMSLCGARLYYVDTETTVRPGDPCSGRQVVFERERDCRKCLRRDAERSEVILMPVAAVVSLAGAAPSLWHQIMPTLSSTVVATVNSQL